MKEFEKWLEALDGIQVADKFNNQNRAIAGCAWRAALKLIERELDKAREGFEPDLGLRKMLEKELNGKT